MPKEFKNLSMGSLMSSIRASFAKTSDSLANKTQYPIADCLMAGLAVFSLKHPSLLQFEQEQSNSKVKHNLKHLFGVEKVPSDTYLRERLDDVDPKIFNNIFKICFNAFQRAKKLPLYYFMDDYVLVSNDGTGFFHSEKVNCDNCCEKKHRDGRVSYYHQIMSAVMVHPNQPQVLPLSIEPIIKQDGKNKNDCERNSSKRLLSNLRKMHPKLKMVIIEDALHSNAPHIRHLKSNGYRYIIGAKPKDHTWLFDWVNASDCDKLTFQRDKFQYKFRWINGAPINESNEDVRVNFFECTETSPKGKKTIYTWITDFEIDKNNIFTLMKGARARWKIENETFNTLKNQGYNFEHNFGHGYKNLSTVFANLMMSAFLIDQILQCCCPKFQAALKKCLKRIRLWEKMRSWFYTFLIDSWDIFYGAIADPPDIQLSPNTS